MTHAVVLLPFSRDYDTELRMMGPAVLPWIVGGLSLAKRAAGEVIR